MKISNKILIILIIAITILWSIQSIYLTVKVANLELQLDAIKIILKSYEEQTESIELLIHRTNPALSDTQVSWITAAISTSAKTNGINRMLLASVAKIESSFVPGAISPANAHGLLQVLPDTFKEVHTGDIDNIRDNVEAGARYLRKLIDRFGDIRLALAAYNCGPSRPIEQILRISGGYADQVLYYCNDLESIDYDNSNGRKTIIISSRW